MSGESFIKLTLILAFTGTKNQHVLSYNPQKHLSPVMILASIIFMNTFVPLSIDLYLPALPQMREYFQASEMLVNMTLIAFFLFFP